MSLFSTIPVSLVALIHIYILYLEMFLWTTPRGRKAFGLSAEYAAQSKVLAANQGLYNGFLAAGLIWGLVHPNSELGMQIQLFFLGCVAVAGVYGAWSVAKWKLFHVQSVPAVVAGGLVLFLA